MPIPQKPHSGAARRPDRTTAVGARPSRGNRWGNLTLRDSHTLQRLHVDRHQTTKLQVENLEPRLTPSAAPVVISEFMAINHSTIIDDSGDSPDWIEIHNRSMEPVSLEGWLLTDSPWDLTKWRFPNITIQPDEYMVLLATGCKAGIECSTDIALQTSFALQSREFLALLEPDGRVASSYGSDKADYPEQRADISYGLTSVDGSSVVESLFMSQPTPGAANQQGYRGFAADVLFGAEHGFYSQSDLLPGGRLAAGIAMTSEPAAMIRYTTDGSAPSLSNLAAHIYQSPIMVAGTTTLRAVATRENYLPSPVSTRSFLFPEDIALHPLRVKAIGSGLMKA